MSGAEAGTASSGAASGDTASGDTASGDTASADTAVADTAVANMLSSVVVTVMDPPSSADICRQFGQSLQFSALDAKMEV